MRTITITFDPAIGSGWDVSENGKHCEGLCWDEMLGQVAMLTIPLAQVGKGYAMRTREEWEAHRQPMAGVQLQQAAPPLQIAGPNQV